MPIVRITVAWLAGIALAAQLPGSTKIWTLAALLSLGVIRRYKRLPLVLRIRSRFHADTLYLPRIAIRDLAVLALALALGGLRWSLARPDFGPNHVTAWAERGRVDLVGRVVAEPDRRDRRTDYRVEVEAWSREGRSGSPAVASGDPDRAQARAGPTNGIVLVQAPSFPAYRYGDRLRIEGELEEPPEIEGFDYRAYLARKGIHVLVRRPHIELLDTGGGWPLRRFLIALRERGRHSLATALPEPESSLAIGILLGDARRIPEAVDEAFRLTNTTHVIAISGSNIALLTALLMLSFGRLLGPRRAVPLVIACIAAYSALVGADAAVVRAAIMGGLMLLAGPLGRPGHATAALMAAGLLMTAWSPHYLWDLGFQLSFAATLGLVAFASRFAESVGGWLRPGMTLSRSEALVRLLNEAVLVTLAAQLTTWPIIAWQTGQVSLAGLAANFLILPAQPAVMGLGGLAMAGGMLAPAIGRLLGVLAWLPLAYTIRVVEAVARLPMAAVEWKMSGTAMLAYYLALGTLWHRPTRAYIVARVDSLRKAISSLRDRGTLSGLRHWWDGIEPAPSPPRSVPAASCATPATSGASRPGRPAQVREQESELRYATVIEHRGAEPEIRIRTEQSGRSGRIAVIGHHLRRALRWSMKGWNPAIALSTLCVLAFQGLRAQPDGLLHLHLLDVGQGDAILVVAPNGQRMLVDGGPSPSALLDELGRLHPPWDRRIDLLVLSHPDADHVTGLTAVARRYQVGTVLDPQPPAESPDAAAWEHALAEMTEARARRSDRAPSPVVLRATRGMRIVLDEEAGVFAEVLWPPEPRLTGVESEVNQNSTVLRLRYGQVSMLLTGDIEQEAEAALLALGDDMASPVLKVAHHGSETSSTPEFLAVTRPWLALIGVGLENRYGHPAPGVLERLAPALVRRTDLDGRVEVLSDGEGLWLR